eukprot:451016-Hanusia_phi.AAC.1
MITIRRRYIPLTGPSRRVPARPEVRSDPTAVGGYSTHRVPYGMIMPVSLAALPAAEQYGHDRVARRL